jgi:phage terminase large subunit
MVRFLPKQLDCLRELATTSPRELVLFGGAAGGSKSFLGCAWQIERRLKYAGTRGLIGRAKLDTLKKTTLKTFFEVAQMYGLRVDKDYRYNAHTNVIAFINGSEIILKDLFAYPSDPLFDSLGSLELTDFFVDEASQVSKKAVDILRSRVRFKLRQLELAPKGLLTCNPHKGWLYAEFYNPWKQNQLPEFYAFVQSNSADNPHLPETYRQTLERLPEVDRLRLLVGDWDYDETADQLFGTENVLRCFRAEEYQGQMFITADIARLGKDRTVIAVWRGLQCLELVILKKQRVPEVVEAIRGLVNRYGVKLANVVCDEDGIGGGAVDLLACRGFLNGGRAKHPERFANLKTECYFKMAELVEQNKLLLPYKHRDEISRELDMIRRRNPDGDGKLAVVGKEEMARLHGISPDIADALMLRMFFELRPNYGVISYI